MASARNTKADSIRQPGTNPDSDGRRGSLVRIPAGRVPATWEAGSSQIRFRSRLTRSATSTLSFKMTAQVAGPHKRDLLQSTRAVTPFEASRNSALLEGRRLARTRAWGDSERTTKHRGGRRQAAAQDFRGRTIRVPGSEVGSSKLKHREVSAALLGPRLPDS